MAHLYSIIWLFNILLNRRELINSPTTVLFLCSYFISLYMIVKVSLV
jgi:hypothetical protein